MASFKSQRRAKSPAVKPIKPKRATLAQQRRGDHKVTAEIDLSTFGDTYKTPPAKRHRGPKNSGVTAGSKGSTKRRRAA